MTLKKRIIVTLAHDGRGNALKPVSFSNNQRNVGSLMQHVKLLSSRNIDELVLIDINATRQGREQNWKLIREYAGELTCPLTVGGGISKLEHIRNALNNGADKVLIKSALNEIFIQSASRYIGSQSISAAIDIFPVNDSFLEIFNSHYLFIAASIYQRWGVGEIFITDATRDGLMLGYNKTILKELRVVKKSTNLISVPIVINGGCGGFMDMANAFDCGADAVAASSIFIHKDITPGDCAEELNKLGYPVRVV